MQLISRQPQNTISPFNKRRNLISFLLFYARFSYPFLHATPPPRLSHLSLCPRGKKRQKIYIQRFSSGLFISKNRISIARRERIRFPTIRRNSKSISGGSFFRVAFSKLDIAELIDLFEQKSFLSLRVLLHVYTYPAG